MAKSSFLILPRKKTMTLRVKIIILQIPHVEYVKYYVFKLIMKLLPRSADEILRVKINDNEFLTQFKIFPHRKLHFSFYTPPPRL